MKNIGKDIVDIAGSHEIVHGKDGNSMSFLFLFQLWETATENH